MSEGRTVRAGDLIGRTEGEALHPPNQADAAWEERVRLLQEAEALGLEVNREWPLVTLREQLVQARAAQRG